MADVTPGPQFDEGRRAEPGPGRKRAGQSGIEKLGRTWVAIDRASSGGAVRIETLPQARSSMKNALAAESSSEAGGRPAEGGGEAQGRRGQGRQGKGKRQGLSVPGLVPSRAIRVRKRLVDQLRVDGALNRALKTLLERARIFTQHEHTQLVALALVPTHLPRANAQPRKGPFLALRAFSEIDQENFGNAWLVVPGKVSGASKQAGLRVTKVRRVATEKGGF